MIVASLDSQRQELPPEAAAPALGPSTLLEFTLYFLRLGTFGFGGPIALAGYMQRDLVEQRRWLSKEDYVQGLALAQLAPGPLAAQLSTYLGWVREVCSVRRWSESRLCCRPF